MIEELEATTDIRCAALELALCGTKRPFAAFATASAFPVSSKPEWGTISRNEIEAQEQHDRWNLDPTGEGLDECIVPVEIRLTKPMR